MHFRSERPLGRACAALALAGVLVASACPADARPRHQQRSLFATLEGTWSGSGAVTTSNGQRERVRCRATYTLQGGERGLNQSLICASASFRFTVSSQLADEGGAISGQWSETSRGVGGSVSGRVSGNQISATVSGNGFSAGLNVSVGTNAHNVTIQPQGSDIVAVQVAFRREG